MYVGKNKAKFPRMQKARNSYLTCRIIEEIIESKTHWLMMVLWIKYSVEVVQQYKTLEKPFSGI